MPMAPDTACPHPLGWVGHSTPGVWHTLCSWDVERRPMHSLLTYLGAQLLVLGTCRNTCFIWNLFSYILLINQPIN